VTSSLPGRPIITPDTLRHHKEQRQPIVMITAYDHPSARIVDEAGVDIVLVGDSAATTVLGYKTTREVTLDEMLMLTRAVARGVTHPLLVGDMPFGSYEAADDDALRTARLMVAAGCAAVKLEGAGPMIDRVRTIVAAGIPVMGHVGLTPQGVASSDGYRARGRVAHDAVTIVRDAEALVGAGCFALVVEAVATPVADAIMARVDIPVIGIGAGPSTDGQVLVFHDLLGLIAGKPARFVKRYAALADTMIAAVRGYADDVRHRRYPGPEHTYSMPAVELDRFRTSL
jgi:3-methyl-2-oxobutanoate hydroxymethyltransferase